MVDEKDFNPEGTLKVIQPDKRTLTPEQQTKLVLKRELDIRSTELGYHKTSVARIDDIRGFLHKIAIKGDECMRLAECLGWLKGVKQNVKGMSEKTNDDVLRLTKELKGVSNDDKNPA